MVDSVPLKTCPFCMYEWQDRFDLILDPTLHINGYQADFADPEGGLILLTHIVPVCRTTLAVHIRHFKDFYMGPDINVLNKGQTGCSRRCLDQSDLESCGAHCSMHWAREVLQFIRNHVVPAHFSPEQIAEE